MDGLRGVGRVPGRLVAWLVERCVEVPLAALLAIVVFADGERLTFELVAQEWRPAFAAIAAFHLMTAYFFTTLFLSVLARTATIKFQSAVMCTAFAVHFGVLFLISGGWSELLPLLPGGVIIVALSTLAGGVVLRLLGSEAARASERDNLGGSLSPAGPHE